MSYLVTVKKKNLTIKIENFRIEFIPWFIFQMISVGNSPFFDGEGEK